VPVYLTIMSKDLRLPVVPDWFTVMWVTARTAVLTEPHMHDLLQANLWYLRGRDCDLLVDAGNGVAPLPPVLARFVPGGRPEVTVVVTHAHIDHFGGFHEFQRCLLHPDKQSAAERIGAEAPLYTAA